MSASIEDVLRECAPGVLGALTRRNGQFDLCEDAVQEAMLAASQQWPSEGIPESPRGWLSAVAQRRFIDMVRSDSARRRREDELALLESASATDSSTETEDDTLSLIFLCCHPQLSQPSQLALTLRAVGGLSTPEIASAFLVPEATMGQRISRAKATIKKAGLQVAIPSEEESADRLAVVLQVLYLIYNEGYVATSGNDLQRTDMAAEAIRLARMLRRLLPEQGEVAGLLALLLLTEARSAARTGPDGEIVPLGEQDRSRWNSAQIAEGVDLLERTLGRHPVGPYQLQASIAAVHDEAPSDAETDWEQILALYGALGRITPGPVITLNAAVALARVHGPQAGLEVLRELEAEGSLAHNHRLAGVQGHLLEQAGQILAAKAAYLRAAGMTANVAEQRYLRLRAAQLSG